MMKSDAKPTLYAIDGATAAPSVALEADTDGQARREAEPGSKKQQRARKAKIYAPLADPAVEDLVRIGDEDRWLASRFAPKPLRQQLTALYALNVELVSVAEKVREPRLGEIRLQWWRDRVEAILTGGPTPDHPVTRALAELRAQVELPLDLFDAMLTARVCDLNHAPFETWADVDSYIEAVHGGLMRLAVLICQPGVTLASAQVSAIQAAARAWGYVDLARSLPLWTARQRTFFPRLSRASAMPGLDPTEIDDASLAMAAHATLDRAIGAQKSFERFVSAIDKQWFPAIGYVALTSLYMREQSKRELGHIRKPVSLLQRQFKLVAAAASGRF